MFVSDEIKITDVHKFKSLYSKKYQDMVMVCAKMPLTLWERLHKYLNVDIHGKPVPLYKPSEHKKVMAVANKKVDAPDIPSPGQLIWEQKNRKEKEK